MVSAVNASGNSGIVPIFDTLTSPKKREKIEALISQYGWESKDLLNEALLRLPGYSDFLDFLYTSKLIYSIRGYEVSLKESDSFLKEGIQIIDNIPHLFMAGVWCPWDEVIGIVEYDSDKREIILKDDPEATEWNYIYPTGLTQQTRYNWIEKVHQLTPNELGRLYQHSLKFFEKEETPPSQENCNYIQVFTAGNSRLGQCGHVGLRMIDQEGGVYSFAFETPNNEARITCSGLFAVLATYNVTIASLDFKEFQKFDVRRTTTIPVTDVAFHRTLEKIRYYATVPLRFNMLHQNCATFVADVLKAADIHLDVRTTSFAKGLYSLAMPMIEPIPVLGFLIRKISDALGWLFSFIGKYTPSPITFLVEVITYIPCMILTMIKNLAFIAFGAAKMGTRPPPDVENEVDNSKRLTAFDRVYNSWTDIFKDDVLNISLAFEVSDWQNEQGSTEIRTYEGPQLYIVPEENG